MEFTYEELTFLIVMCKNYKQNLLEKKNIKWRSKKLEEINLLLAKLAMLEENHIPFG